MKELTIKVVIVVTNNEKLPGNSIKLQSKFITKKIKSNNEVKVLLNSGRELNGTITDVDKYTLTFRVSQDDEDSLLFKHHIEAVRPIKNKE